MSSSKAGGLRAAFGCTPEALALFRIAVGLVLVSELVLRFRFLHAFYTDEGTAPLRLFLPKIDDLYKLVCLHCHFGELWQQQVLLLIQTFVAVLFTVGYQTRVMAIASWYLYMSAILRNTWLYFILDRYIFYMLFFAMFLPLDECWSVTTTNNKLKKGTTLSQRRGIVVSPATVGLKLLILWIYMDAGWGKYLDPLKGWSYHADPLPALDTYTRHTVAARYLYGMLGPEGLRTMTPIVVWIEIIAAPLAFLGSYLGWAGMVKFAVGLICQLHIGISFSLRNSFLLSYIACSAWCVFLPIGWEREQSRVNIQPSATTNLSKLGTVISAILIGGMACGNLWFETIGASCASSDVAQIWSTLLQNRWNVFIGAEEYVTWEIAPGRLADGSVVDVWGRTDAVNWSMPGTGGAPCTSTSRPGRWRSFPYLADLEGEDAEVLWGYLCKQWDDENNAEQNPGRKLLRYNFFMLQADVLPNMGFSSTRKRLVHSYECVPEEMEQLDFSASASVGGASADASQEHTATSSDENQGIDSRGGGPDEKTLHEEAEL